MLLHSLQAGQLQDIAGVRKEARLRPVQHLHSLLDNVARGIFELLLRRAEHLLKHQDQVVRQLLYRRVALLVCAAC